MTFDEAMACRLPDGRQLKDLDLRDLRDLVVPVPDDTRLAEAVATIKAALRDGQGIATPPRSKPEARAKDMPGFMTVELLPGIYETMSTRTFFRRLLFAIGIVAFVVLALIRHGHIIGIGLSSASSVDADMKRVAAPEATPAQSDQPMGTPNETEPVVIDNALAPASVELIVAVLSRYASEYHNASHDAQRDKVRRQRAADLCAQLQKLIGEPGEDGYQFRSWTGRLSDVIGPTIFNDFVVTIDLPYPLSMQADIDKRSELADRLVSISLGATVKVDGALIADRTDCIEDRRWTTSGMMWHPQFHFTANRIEIQ